MGSGRGTTVYGQLLLCAALLLGIFTMHTLGHPVGHRAGHSSSTTAAEHSTAPSPRTLSMSSTVSSPGTLSMASSMSGGTTAGAPHVAAHHPHRPLPGMDPGSVCLAVLGVWGLALLAARLVSARGRTAGAAVARGRTPRPRWPDPPPPYGSSVAALSVLRQ